MKTSRILIFEERPSPARDLPLNFPDHAVEFDFRDAGKGEIETVDLSRYAAIVAPVESARNGMMGVLADANRYGGPLFLYRGEPPVHEVARWVLWGSPSHGGPEGPAADRFGRIEKISLRDPETGAYSAPFLADYFEKERNKASRFHRPLSVVFLVVENYSSLIEKMRESIVVGALTSMVKVIHRAVRESDLVAREEANRFCIVLPETDSFGALLAVRRLRKAIKDSCRIRSLGSEYLLQPFFMSATCPVDGMEFPDLLRVAEEKFARQQKSPLHRLRLADRPFWDAFETLVGKREQYDLFRRGEEVPSFLRFRKDLGRNAHFSVPRETWLRILEAVAQDVAANPQERGLVIAAGPTPEIYKQIFLSFEPSVTPHRIIYVVGQSGSTRFDSRNLMYVATEDELLKDREFILYLKEGGAYGVFCSARESEVDGFNTADESLVEAMIEKVKEMYRLQGNF